MRDEEKGKKEKKEREIRREVKVKRRVGLG